MGPQPWYVQQFERLRTWMLTSDRQAKKQPFWRRHQVSLFCTFFVLFWFACYWARYGLPFSDWTVSDWDKFIPGKYRQPAPSAANVVSSARHHVSGLDHWQT